MSLEQEVAHAAQKTAKEAEVSQAFLKYMGSIGVFADFEDQRVDFEQTHVGWRHAWLLSADVVFAFFLDLLGQQPGSCVGSHAG